MDGHGGQTRPGGAAGRGGPAGPVGRVRPEVPGYEVLSPLGDGATSSVWRARRRADGLVVALKVLHPAPHQVEAGLREAGLLAGVRHEHLVRLYDVVPLPDAVTGRVAGVALAMQLAPGGNLGQLLRRRRMLSPGEVVTVLLPVSAALTELHTRGVVHGDLSTGNVVFQLDGMPLLADLGASRIAGDPAGDPRGTGAASGMVAPEVIEGFAPTPEADVYALGALAWQCLVGAPPGPGFAREPLAHLSPDLPADLVAMVERALAPQPEDRPDADELGAALVAAARPEPVEVAPDADPGHRLTERLRQQAREEATEGKHREETAVRRGPRVALVAAAAMVVAAAALLVSGVVPVPTLPTPAAQDAQGGQAAQDGQAAQGDRDAQGGQEAPAVPQVVGTEESRGEEPDPAGVELGDEAVEEGPAGEGTDEDGHAAASAEIVQGLVDRRGLAWERGDVDLLAESMAPGSPALAAETERLERVREAGVSYADVTFRVEEVDLVEEDGDRLTLRAVVSRAPLVAFAPDGARADRPTRTDEVLLVLAGGDVDAPEDWRLWSWDEG